MFRANFLELPVTVKLPDFLGLFQHKTLFGDELSRSVDFLTTMSAYTAIRAETARISLFKFSGTGGTSGVPPVVPSVSCPFNCPVEFHRLTPILLRSWAIRNRDNVGT